MDGKKQQELMFKLSMFEQQIQQLQHQIQAVEQGVVELSNLNFGLGDLKGSEGKEVMTSIGKGIFTKTKLISEDLIVDVGGKNFVKKSISETQQLLQKQIKKLEEIKKELEDSLEKVVLELQKVYSEGKSKN